MTLSRSELRHLAIVGARERLKALDQEKATILKTFPELRTGALAVANDHAPRRRMSAAQRRAASERMKKYWAQKKKAAK